MRENPQSHSQPSIPTPLGAVKSVGTVFLITTWIQNHAHVCISAHVHYTENKWQSRVNQKSFSPSWAFIRCVSSTHTWSINTGMATCTCYTFRNMWIRCPTWMTNCGTVASFLAESEGLGYEASGTGIYMCLMGNGRLACKGRSLHFRVSRIQVGGEGAGLRENWGGCVCVCVCVCAHVHTCLCDIHM